MASSGSGRPAIAILAVGVACLSAAFYLWSVAAALAADPSPSGAACEVARGYIVMDDQDLVTGIQRIRWLPIPVTECVWSEGSRDVWSIFHLLGIPVALCVAGVAGWGFARCGAPRDEGEMVDV